MLRVRASALSVGLFLAGCASSGGIPSEGAPADGAPAVATSVPVFDSAEDVPCAYEVIRTVRGESDASTGGSPDRYERERERVLGRAGARIGANAVLVEPVSEMRGVQRRVVVSAPAGSPPPLPPAPNLQFEGEALRYLPGCTANG
jgi:hypothetical protein